MLSTRGVPGTHDIALMQSVIDDLKTGKNTEVPHFDKAEDDRGGFTPVVSRELSLLIIEGWCWGAMPAEGDELDHPVNVGDATLTVNSLMVAIRRFLLRPIPVCFFRFQIWKRLFAGAGSRNNDLLKPGAMVQKS